MPTLTTTLKDINLPVALLNHPYTLISCISHISYLRVSHIFPSLHRIRSDRSPSQKTYPLHITIAKSLEVAAEAETAPAIAAAEVVYYSPEPKRSWCPAPKFASPPKLLLRHCPSCWSDITEVFALPPEAAAAPPSKPCHQTALPSATSTVEIYYPPRHRSCLSPETSTSNCSAT